MAEIVWSSPAEDDMKMIHDYISMDSEFHASKVIDRIYACTYVLQEHIRVGKVVQELKNPLIRELREGYYRIIYKVESEELISILRVYHSARILKKL